MNPNAPARRARSSPGLRQWTDYIGEYRFSGPARSSARAVPTSVAKNLMPEWASRPSFLVVAPRCRSRVLRSISTVTGVLRAPHSLEWYANVLCVLDNS